MADLKPTLEQEAIIDAGVNGDTFVVDAVAGSGKTSTLRMASQAMAESKILYLVYNRAAADDARKVFPKNVTVKTTAAMAFGAYKGMYGDRILGPRVPANQTAAMLGLTKPLELGQDIFFRPYSLAVLAVETVDRFCHTADIEVETHHVPPLPLGLSVIQEDTLRQEVTFWARKLWKDSQNPTSKHRFTFDYAFKCQPAGTLVKIVDRKSVEGDKKRGWKPVWRDVRIEDVKPGDKVVSAGGDHYFRVMKNGSEVTRVGTRHYDGQLITVTTESGESSSYTHDHISIAAFGDDLNDKHIVYMMRKGVSHRIGKSRWKYGEDQAYFGPTSRIKHQEADGFWILSVHETAEDAALAEALACHEYNIPEWQFVPSRETVAGVPLDAFWTKVGDNSNQASRCLSDHGRDIKYPLWSKGEAPLGVRSAHEIRACNFIDGMKVCTLSGAQDGPNGQMFTRVQRGWSTVVVSRAPYAGQVYSLDVDRTHVYFGDGILTHNCWVMDEPAIYFDTVMLDEAQDSNGIVEHFIKQQYVQKVIVGDPAQQLYAWRGAVNIMDRFEGERLSLSQSWRFGERIAEEADKWLAHTGTGIKVKGNPAMDSVVTDESFGRPDAVLCRTNATAVDRAMFYLSHGLRVAVAGGTKQLVALAYAAGELKQGKETTHQELIAFKTWKELVDFTEEPGGGDLKALVNLIQIHGVGGILDACKLLVDENKGNPDVTVSTAHKSKGREWMRVEVAADFKPPHGVPDPFGGEVTPGPIPKADAMLHYVTVTRARQSLNRGGLTWIDDYADLVIDKW